MPDPSPPSPPPPEDYYRLPRGLWILFQTILFVAGLGLLGLQAWREQADPWLIVTAVLMMIGLPARLIDALLRRS